eukprot:jgi/Ulvmu1/2156/UM129_0016.1
MQALLRFICRNCLYVAVWYLQLCRFGQCRAQPLRIHLVAHSHDDSGWLKTVDQYYTGSEQKIQLAGVEYVLDTVVQCLNGSDNRTFSFAEIAFFSRWWAQQNQEIQSKVKALVSGGQLTFVNGGWVQHDEATSHFSMMIDQTTRGHDFLLRTFNVTPTVAWQIDPFGHSNTQASLLTARAGFDAVFFARADYDDLSMRKAAGQAEAVWRGAAATYGSSADVFMGNFPNHYGPPKGFNYEWGSPDPPVQDDPRVQGYNAAERADALVAAAEAYADTSRGADVMVLMGTDFTYSNALTWYKNMDRLIAAVNRGGRAHALYSTPAAYLAAKAAYGGSWPLRTDDLFPYADSPHTYWTGFFSSRPTLKGYIYHAARTLATSRKAAALLTLHGDCGMHSQGLRAALDKLDAAVALSQHHDAVTGTAKQAVTNDYACRLAAASASVHINIAHLISAAIFTPHACMSCMTAAAAANSSGIAQRDPAADVPDLNNSWHAPHAARAEAVRGEACVHGGQADRYAKAEGQRTVQEASSRSVEEEVGGPGQGAEKGALDELPRLWPCEHGNVSACAATVDASRNCESFAVVLFNSVAWPREENVRVPLARPDCHYSVVNADSQELPSAVVPVSQATWCTQQLLSLYDALPAAAAGWYEATFQAAVPAIGYSTVLLIPGATPATLALNHTLPDMHALDASAVSSAVSHVPLPDGVHAWHVSSCAACAAVALRPGGEVARLAAPAPALPGTPAVLENEHLELRFSRGTGRLVSVLHKDTGQRVNVDLDLVYWESNPAPPYGGAYIMRPTTQVPLSWPSGASRVTLDIVTSPVVSEARQAFVGWGTLTTRLWRGAHAVEVEWTVGPVPVMDGVGKEVALRVRSDLDSGDIWWTDANGRHMQQRRRSWRRSWTLQNTEPIAGNFYPVTSAATLRGAPPPHDSNSAASAGDAAAGAPADSNSAAGAPGQPEFELSLVTDRAQGVASLESGSMHVLLHRRLLNDDNRGVAEPLNETVCGCRDCDCPGLVARGTFQMLLAPATPDTHRRLREAQVLSAELPLPLYGRGSDIVRWLTAHMHVGDDDEVSVGAGSAVEDVGTAARPGWGRAGERVGSNASDLWPVGASGLLASHPLAKAVLKKIGDHGVIRIETSAAGFQPGNATHRRDFHQQHSRSPQLHWSAAGAPLAQHAGTCHGLACAADGSAVMPPDLSLLTFTSWHGAIFESPRAGGVHGGGDSNGSECSGSTAQHSCGEGPPGAHECSGKTEQFYLVRVANNADTADLPSGSAEEEAQRRTVDLCRVLAWPRASAVRVRETTLTGNRGLRAFTAAGGRTPFRAHAVAQCFKDDVAGCSDRGRGAEEPHPEPAARCAHSAAIDVTGVDCSSGTVPVCVDAMDVRTFVLGVAPART